MAPKSGTSLIEIQSPYAVSSSFIIIAPLFVGAGNYLLISRLALRVLPTSIKRIYRIPVGKLTRIFVVCDVVTLLIQASGSGIASSGNWKGKMADVGNNVLIVGLAIQLATFTFFVVIVSKFHFLTRKEGNVSDEAGHAWKKVLFAVYISSTLIIVCCKLYAGLRGRSNMNLDPMHLSSGRIRSRNLGISLHS